MIFQKQFIDNDTRKIVQKRLWATTMSYHCLYVCVCDVYVISL